ncbi:phytanoyl-CoA dioxygenase family protein [Shinella sumterensis]|uniref:phytanoyl-CoA dioxygenase family protein n=1 Tax=Shinella sumterensis TaxID=1967501 RepID=UPI003F83AB7C
MINAQAQAAYTKNGYLNVDNIFGPDEVHSAVDELEMLYREFPSGTRARMVAYHPDGIDAGQARIDHPHLVSGAVNALLRAPSFCEAIRRLLGVETAQVWYCHALRKPGETDAANHVGWHQDGQYAGFLSGTFMTAWIPLVDIDENASPLIYVRGSHRYGRVAGSGFSHKASLEELKESILSNNEIPWNEEKSTGKAGFVSFHHSDLIHGSAGNNGGGTRYSLACHLRTEQNRLLPEHDYKGAVGQIRDLELSPVVCGDARSLDFGEGTA